MKSIFKTRQFFLLRKIFLWAAFGRFRIIPSISKLGLRETRRYSQQPQTEKNIVTSPLGEVSVPKIPFHELIFQNWSLWENKTAIICGSTGRKYSYKKILIHSKALAASFQNKFNLNKGDFIAVILINCPEYPILILGSSLNGVVPTTVNPLYTIYEISLQLKYCQPKVIVTDQNSYEKCVGVTKEMKTGIPIVVIRTTPNAEVPQGAVDFFEIADPDLANTLNPVHIDHDDTVVLPFSSGTTGIPKGVILTHSNLVSNLTQLEHPESMLMNPTTKFHQDVVFGILPMFHIYGLVIATFSTLKEGCKLVVLPRFNPRLFISNIVKKKVNIIYVVPPILTFLGRQEVLSKHLKSVQYAINAASALSPSDVFPILEKAEHIKIAQGYGMTESSPALAHTSRLRMQKITSVGVPLASTKLKISSLETGEALPKNQRGELCAFGPQIMKGYLNSPEETKLTVDEEGWLRTGDIAYYDDDGDFFIVDRKKDLIKVKGFQVAPAELEEVLKSHPKIKDCVVVGVPDKDHGEVPRAFVVVKKGLSMTDEEVQDFVKRKLSSYKHLKGGVKFMEDLPKNNIGKVLRKELKNFD